jgi:hypothetical protein
MDTFEDVLKTIPKLPQRQDSLNAQICDLIIVANRLGMYDVADFLAQPNTFHLKKEFDKRPRF